jgi:GNAT superfamily N-acetyltransferase
MLNTEMLKTEALVTTYLEMQARSELRNAERRFRNEEFDVRELKEPEWEFNREMYFQVGEQWKWTDKRPWTNGQWQDYANDRNLRTFAGYCGEAIIGYYELKRVTALRNSGQKPLVSVSVSAEASQAGQNEADPTRHMSHVTCHSNDEVEIAYFGLLLKFIGRGLGGALLTSAIENAWAWSPTPSRVWVHTCNRDHPSALANYQARGFKIYKTVTGDPPSHEVGAG